MKALPELLHDKCLTEASGLRQNLNTYCWLPGSVRGHHCNQRGRTGAAGGRVRGLEGVGSRAVAITGGPNGSS